MHVFNLIACSFCVRNSRTSYRTQSCEIGCGSNIEFMFSVRQCKLHGCTNSSAPKRSDGNRNDNALWLATHDLMCRHSRDPGSLSSTRDGKWVGERGRKHRRLITSALTSPSKLLYPLLQTVTCSPYPSLKETPLLLFWHGKDDVHFSSLIEETPVL